jgi:hypothetical protein
MLHISPSLQSCNLGYWSPNVVPYQVLDCKKGVSDIVVVVVVVVVVVACIVVASPAVLGVATVALPVVPLVHHLVQATKFP